VETTAGAWLEGRGLLAFAVYALATLIGGALLHYAVERPFLRLRERRERRASVPRHVALVVVEPDAAIVAPSPQGDPIAEPMAS
jgi:peptidoglycan/LPS O-acetylase OafA/YrhL